MKPKITKVVFLGSKELGLCALKTIHSVSPGSLRGVMTFDDRTDSRTKLKDYQAFTRANKIPLFIVKDNKHAEELIRELKPQLCFVTGWYWLISEATLSSVAFGFVILHNSLLPRLRGAAPLVWAMINEDKRIGFSLFIPGKGIDDGPILAQGAVNVGADDYIGDVIKKLEIKIKQVLQKAYPTILNGTIKPKRQNHALVTFGAGRIPSDGNINWTRPARQVYNFIRAQSDPFPGAFTHYGKSVMKIWRAKLHKGRYHGTPGQVAAITSQGVYIICGDDQAIIAENVEIDGQRGNPKDFVRTVKARFTDRTVLLREQF